MRSTAIEEMKELTAANLGKRGYTIKMELSARQDFRMPDFFIACQRVLMNVYYGCKGNST